MNFIFVLLAASVSLGFQERSEELFKVETQADTLAEAGLGRALEQEPKVKAKSSETKRREVVQGNLPSAYRARSNAALDSTTSRTILPPEIKSRLKELKSGEMLTAHVNHSVIAFPDEKAPVVAVITEGELKGMKVIGESRLESNTKRIFVEFTRLMKDREEYPVKALALNAQGQPGLEGEYHSREGLLFAGDVVASTIAAYFDGQVPRYRTVFGEVADTSPASAVKKGLAGGALSSAERLREKLKKVPEYSEVAPGLIQILVL